MISDYFNNIASGKINPLKTDYETFYKVKFEHGFIGNPATYLEAPMRSRTYGYNDNNNNNPNDDIVGLSYYSARLWHQQTIEGINLSFFADPDFIKFGLPKLTQNGMTIEEVGKRISQIQDEIMPELVTMKNNALKYFSNMDLYKADLTDFILSPLDKISIFSNMINNYNNTISLYNDYLDKTSKITNQHIPELYKAYQTNKSFMGVRLYQDYSTHFMNIQKYFGNDYRMYDHIWQASGSKYYNFGTLYDEDNTDIYTFIWLN